MVILFAFFILGYSQNCISLKDSKVCAGLENYMVDSNTSALHTAVDDFFHGQKGDVFRIQGETLTSASDFDSFLTTKLSQIDLKPFFQCDVAKEKIMYWNSYLCVWAVFKASQCQQNTPPPLCSSSTNEFFQSFQNQVSNQNECPDVQQNIVTKRLQELLAQTKNRNVPQASRVFNGEQNSCFKGESVTGLCGFQDNETACRNGCPSADCPLFSPLWIILITILIILIVGILIVVCFMATKDKEEVEDKQDIEARKNSISEKPVKKLPVMISTPIVEVGELNEDSIGKILRCKARFSPDLPDEIAVLENDQCRILELHADGWAKVQLLSNANDIIAEGAVPKAVFLPKSPNSKKSKRTISLIE